MYTFGHIRDQEGSKCKIYLYIVVPFFVCSKWSEEMKFLQHAMRVCIIAFLFNGDDEEDEDDGTISYGEMVRVWVVGVLYRVYRFHKPSVFLN